MIELVSEKSEKDFRIKLNTSDRKFLHVFQETSCYSYSIMKIISSGLHLLAPLDSWTGVFFPVILLYGE